MERRTSERETGGVIWEGGRKEVGGKGGKSTFHVIFISFMYWWDISFLFHNQKPKSRDPNIQDTKNPNPVTDLGF